MKNINIFCFGFGQVAKNFIKKLSIEKYNIILTTTSRGESSEKIFNDLGFKAKKTVKNAVEDLIDAFKKNKFQDPLSNDNYFNIKKMQKIKLK